MRPVMKRLIVDGKVTTEWEKRATQVSGGVGQRRDRPSAHSPPTRRRSADSFYSKIAFPPNRQPKMHQSVKEILLDIERLDPFPATAAAVLEVIMESALQPHERIEKLLPLISQDTGLTTRVLRAANSSLRGSLAPVHSLRRACIELGSEATSSLALASSLSCHFMGLGGSTLRSNQSLWFESVATAIACRFLAEESQYPDLELAFTAGLLQNMAFIVMDRFLRREQGEIQGRIDLGRKGLQAEREVLGVDHTFVGSRIARKWRLPGILIDVIKNHHTPDSSSKATELCRIANVGEVLVWELLSVRGQPRMGYSAQPGVFRQMRLKTALSELPDLLIKEIKKNHALLES